jgi:muramoyltetrapeptide carboxypeptidase
MKPRALKSGSLICLVTPASPIAADKVERATALLEENGYRVKLGESVFASDSYLAGSDAERAADLQRAFDDPEVDAVFCTRGGYGCARLFPYLDLDRIASSGTMFLGFSDVTALHGALNRRGMPTVHAPMALTLAFDREPWVYESLLAVLRGDDPVHADAPKGQCVVDGVADGLLVGGCMCLVCDTIGTPEEVAFNGNLLLLEDVDEAPHRVDAMLTHLLNSGRAECVAGFVVGEMTRTDEKIDEGIGGKPWREIVRDRLEPLGKPLIIDFPVGHAKNMLSMPLGISARLDAREGSVSYLESLCA